MSQKYELSVHGVSIRFGGLNLLRGASFDIESGERLGLVGANGAGKSTLLRIVGGWMMPDQGNVYMFGEEINKWTPIRRYAYGLREVPQFPDACLALTGLEMIAIGQAGSRLLKAKWIRQPQRIHLEDHPFLERLLSYTDFSSTLAKLSFGSRKMITIAAVLASRPRLLLLDEPTAGLDGVQRQALARVLATMAECTMLIVEHDVKFVKEACSRVIELREGTVHECDR